MIRLPPRSTRTDTLFPDTTLFRSRIGAAVGRAGSLLVREGRREPIRRQTRTLEHLARVIRPVGDLEGGRQRFHLGFREADIAKVAEGHILHRVTGGADFFVDLIATLQLAPVERAERARTEERRGGKECVRTWRTRGAQYT